MEGLGLPNLQGIYDADTSLDHITLDGVNPLTLVAPIASSAATAVVQSLVRDDGGNGAIGDGVAQDLMLFNGAGARVNAFRVSAEWLDATAGSEDTEVVFSTRQLGLFVESMRLRATGIDTAILSPFAFVLQPNSQTADGLRITVSGGDTFVIPQVSTNEFFLGNTEADPSVDLNRGASRALDIIPLGTTITALGGGGGNWINFGSNVVLDYVNATVSGLVAFSGEMRFRQNGNGAGAGNLFKMQGVFTNEIGSNVRLGSQYTFVHVGTYRADGAGVNQANLFHRVCLLQARWDAINGATQSLTTVNAGGYVNPVIAAAAGVSITNMRDWEWGNAVGAGVATDRAALYVPDMNAQTNSTVVLRALMAAGATKRFLDHTGTAISRIGGALFIGTGGVFDWSISRLVANVATLGAGDSLRIPATLFMGAAGSVSLSEGAANRLDLATGDSLRIINGAFEHLAGTVGFYGSAPVAQSAAYTPTNVTPDRAYDANATTLSELADVLGTLVADLQLTGIIG